MKGRKIWIGWLCGLLSVACGGEEKTLETFAPHYLQFACGEVQSKGLMTTETIAVEGNAFGVVGRFAYGSTYRNPVTLFDNRKVSYSRDAWQYERPESWNSGCIYRFRAYFPHGTYEVIDDLNSSYRINNFTVSDQVERQVDLLVSEAEEVVTPNNLYSLSEPMEPVKFSFSHLLCNVRVALKKKSDNPETIQLTRVQLSGMMATGSYTATHAGVVGGGTWTPDEGSSLVCSRDFSAAEGVLPANGNPLSVWSDGLLLIPQEVGSIVLTLYFKVSHGEDVVMKSATLSLPTTEVWACGKVITYTATIEKTNHDITFTTPVVEPWGTSQVAGTVIIK